MNKTKGFNYDTEKDMDVIRHIAKQPNQSQYILDLVRKDMANKNSFENTIEKYVIKILRDKNIKVTENNSEIKINKKDINQLLNIR